MGVKEIKIEVHDLILIHSENQQVIKRSGNMLTSRY